MKRRLQQLSQICSMQWCRNPTKARAFSPCVDFQDKSAFRLANVLTRSLLRKLWTSADQQFIWTLWWVRTLAASPNQCDLLGGKGVNPIIWCNSKKHSSEGYYYVQLLETKHLVWTLITIIGFIASNTPSSTYASLQLLSSSCNVHFYIDSWTR